MKHMIMLIHGLVWVASLQSTTITLMTRPLGEQKGSGHYAVTRSLLDGLKKIGCAVIFNPKAMEQVTEVVHVLSNVKALQQAIEWRKKGLIKKLIAGPNLVVRSNEHDHLLASPYIDVCIVPSDWVKQAYIQDEPTLEGRIVVWTAGVDTEFWQPDLTAKSPGNNVLIYWKTQSERFYTIVETLVKEAGWNPIRIKYGSYKKDDYKKALNSAFIAVFISRSESQGIALAECWAMDVPTLVWEYNEPFSIGSKKHWPISSAPYLTIKTGFTWKTSEELHAFLQNPDLWMPHCSPRQWVLEHMSDQVCAGAWKEIMDGI